jgi:hypothetical protein
MLDCAALAPQGIARVPLTIAVNADSLATWFAPAVAACAADAPVLVEVALDDEDCTAEWLRSGAVPAAARTALSQRHDSTARSRPPRPTPALPIPHLRQRPLALQLLLDAVVELASIQGERGMRALFLEHALPLTLLLEPSAQVLRNMPHLAHRQLVCQSLNPVVDGFAVHAQYLFRYPKLAPAVIFL